MAATKVDVDGRIWISTRDIEQLYFGSHVPELEQYRRYYGRNVNPGVIEEVLIAASYGHMRDLTDLGYETLKLDTHLASTVGKRVRAPGSIVPKVTPRTGDGIDPAEANRYADMVRRQLFAIPRLRQRIINLSWASFFARAALEIEWHENPWSARERWRIRDLHWIHPRRLSLGPERELRVRDDLFYGMGFEARGFDLREIPFKFVVSRRQLFNDYPEREGLLPPCLYFAYFKRFSWRERLTLTELFGKPWRWIELVDPAIVDPELLETAKEQADAMGANNSAVLPPGAKLIVQSAGQNAGQIHKEIHDDVNDEISKLVLGSTRTTDAKADGLGGGQALVHQDSETLVFTTDCDEIAEDLTLGLARAIVLLNGGPEAADLYTPRIDLTFELPPNPSEEIDRTSKALALGIALKLDEVYERIGFAKPEPGDETIKQEAPPLGGLFSEGSGTQTRIQEGADSDLRRISLAAFKTRRALMSDVTKRVVVGGLTIHIDRPIGYVQEGVDADGVPWTRTYKADYGFLPRTEGGDGEAIDVFVGPNPDSSSVWWVKQRDRWGAFDEYKLFVGFDHAQDVITTYGEHIPMQFFASMAETTLEQVKALLGVPPKEQLTNRDLVEERVRRLLRLAVRSGG